MRKIIKQTQVHTLTGTGVSVRDGPGHRSSTYSPGIPRCVVVFLLPPPATTWATLTSPPENPSLLLRRDDDEATLGGGGGFPGFSKIQFDASSTLLLKLSKAARQSSHSKEIGSKVTLASM